MRRDMKYILSVALLICSYTSLPAQQRDDDDSSITVNDSGAEILAFRLNGSQCEGELLSVRQNSIMIINSSACKDKTKKWECIDQVEKDDIDKLIIKGNSNIALGFGAGLAAGLISLAFTLESKPGGITNLPSYKYSEEVTTWAFLGCVIIGGLIGLITSTPDEVIDPFSEYDISGLSSYAKFPNGEPQYLKEIK